MPARYTHFEFATKDSHKRAVEMLRAMRVSFGYDITTEQNADMVSKRYTIRVEASVTARLCLDILLEPLNCYSTFN